MSFENNLKVLLEKISEAALLAGRKPEDIKLVVVTKGRSLEEIQEAYSYGLRDFGENRVDEALRKREQLPADIRWHFIGKLQKNKVNKVIGKFALIHSVDGIELAQKISHASLQQGIHTAILLEANTSGETTKSGLSPDVWKGHFSQLQALAGIDVQGLMTMAPLTEDEARIRHCFAELRLLGQALQQKGGEMGTLSMGMTHDFPIAIQEGATLLRIGTALFAPQ